MHLLAIGDLHGRNVWETIDVTTYDQVIFVGDYVDSYFYDDAHILANLQNLIDLKRKFPQKVVLLLGNHDAQYLHFPRYSCSGFRPKAQIQLTRFFVHHAELFKIAHRVGSYLFTHAGVCEKWYNSMRKSHTLDGFEHLPIDEQLNTIHADRRRQHLLFEVGFVRGGADGVGGPIWADRSETIGDYLAGYHQVVGHTPIDEIKTVGDRKSSITYIDVTEKLGSQFFEIKTKG